jgi:hypothetical protein
LLYAKLFFAQFHKRLAVKNSKKKYFLAKKDLQRIGCKTLFGLSAEIFLQTIGCKMLICYLQN